ncbi:MAG: flagellar assembly peptidoglycan hydrolase FlgJ [Rhodanobacter sp.]|nr:MAG: flagellar assembly peptidoglycan hydrolase FlgJ [Rhodanobacter sp.]
MASGVDFAAQSVNTWTDLSGFAALRQKAQTDSKAALPVVAKQFESIFTEMMLKSMRAASYGNPLFDSQGGKAWQGLFDQQLSVSLSQQGRGLGIAEMLVRQLGGKHSGAAQPSGHAVVGAANDAPAPGQVDDWKKRLDSVVAVASSAGKVVSKLLPGDPQAFVATFAPYAYQVARKLGVSMRAVLAQAALETHWGRHMPAHPDGSSSNNLFGIKAGSSWAGTRVNVPTLEFEGGVPVRRQAQFRAYPSPAASFANYAELVGSNPRYAGALGKGDDVLGFARGLVEGGYATDPNYATKVAAVANSPVMRKALAALKNAVNLPTSVE